jgi:hypothetical protein
MVGDETGAGRPGNAKLLGLPAFVSGALGIEPVFWQNEPKDEPHGEPDVLPPVRPG